MPKIKLSFIQGLRSVVLKEIYNYPNLITSGEHKDSIFVDFVDNFDSIKMLKSVARAYLVLIDPKFHPLYISKHKSILGDLIKIVIDGNKKGSFKTYKITCAGSDSPEVREINKYVEENYSLVKEDEADLKIHIIKIDEMWEVGIQITPRPLSVREYKVANMSGAMDPTIAYAMNSLAVSQNSESYLNVFSGSGTLLIEAAECFEGLENLIGFDNDKEHLTLSIQNIKKAGLIKRVQVKEGDIFNAPDFGKFDVITSDLPFGMVISKNEDLSKLYSTFLQYSAEHLNEDGVLAVYTSETEILEKIIPESKFELVNSLDLKFITKVDAYIYPKIFICKLKL